MVYEIQDLMSILKTVLNNNANSKKYLILKINIPLENNKLHGKLIFLQEILKIQKDLKKKLSCMKYCKYFMQEFDSDR